MQAFAGVFVMVMPGRPGSYEQSCGTLFDWAGMRFGWISSPDPAGFSRARKRLTVRECMKVFTLASAWAAKNFGQVAGPVAGRPLVAVDGTILHLPRSKGLVNRFGVPTDSLGVKELAHYPQAMLVSAWDVVRRVPLTWRLTPHKVGERDTFLTMLKDLPSNAVLLLDRGYPSHEVLEAIVSSGRDVVMRMVASEAGGSWKVVAEFLASNAPRAVVEIACGKGRKAKRIKVLLVRRTFRPGRPGRHQSRQLMVVMTTMVEAGLSDDQVLDLYAKRWGIETLYRDLKSLADVEGWHSKTTAGIEQELIALMTWFTVSAVIAHTAQAATGHAVRANSRRVFEGTAYAIEALFMAAATDGRTSELFIGRANEALRRIEKWANKQRLGRSASRKAKHPYARSTEKSHG